MTTLLRLEYFVAIIDEGSITAAASALRITQPALSRQLAALETEVGVRLFERNGRKTTLTAAGHIYESVARSLLQHAAQVELAGRELRSGRPSTLTIAAPDSTMSEVIAPCLAMLDHSVQPVTARSITSLIPAVEALKLADLAITAGPPDPTLSTLTLGAVPVCAHVPAAHPWARREVNRIDISELEGAELIVQTPNNRSRVLLDTVLAARGVSAHITATSELESIVQALAAAGYGVGVLTESPKFGARSLRIYDGDQPLEVIMRASWRSSHFAAEAIATLAERLRVQLQSATAQIADSQNWD